MEVGRQRGVRRDEFGVAVDVDVVLVAVVILPAFFRPAGVDDLSALEFDAEISQRLVQPLEQDIGQPVRLERFTEGPDGAGIGHAARQLQTKEAHEGESVGDLKLQALVGRGCADAAR